MVTWTRRRGMSSWGSWPGSSRVLIATDLLVRVESHSYLTVMRDLTYLHVFVIPNGFSSATALSWLSSNTFWEMKCLFSTTGFSLCRNLLLNVRLHLQKCFINLITLILEFNIFLLWYPGSELMCSRFLGHLPTKRENNIEWEVCLSWIRLLIFVRYGGHGQLILTLSFWLKPQAIKTKQYGSYQSFISLYS